MVSEVTFFPGKKAYIVNMDETQVPIDGASRSLNHVSCRVMICHDLPRPGKPATKTGGHCTFILTINALGECGPPFFIFDTSSKVEENRKVRPQHLANLPYVRGTFGADTATDFSSEFAVTENGSMDKTLWPQFVRKTLYKLYPKTQAEYVANGTVVEHRICLKVDGGPGKSDFWDLLELSAMGIDLFPGFPMGSGYNQECDDIYADLKMALFKQCDKLESMYGRGLTNQDVGQVMNGCQYWTEGPHKGEKVPPEFRPMMKVITAERIRTSWRHIGAVPLTRESTKDPRLRDAGAGGIGTSANAAVKKVNGEYKKAMLVST